MATLHTVNKSPFQAGALTSCLAHIKEGDTVLMLEDGIYGALTGTGFSDKVQASGAKICVLGPDVSARGIDATHILASIKTVDYDGFVDLAAASARVQAWL